MTREEIEQINESEPYCFETDREVHWYRIGLIEGLKVADNNPKSPCVNMKYRPFKNNAECWQEMEKHSNFGWVIRSGVFLMVQSIYLDAIHTIEDKHGIDFKEAFTELTFTDGTPFGIKEE